MYYYNNELPPQQGWICPKCGRVNAPWLPTCDCVRSQTSGTIRTNTDVWEYKGDGKWGKAPTYVTYTAYGCSYGKWKENDEKTCYKCQHYKDGVGCTSREMYHTERSE